MREKLIELLDAYMKHYGLEEAEAILAIRKDLRQIQLLGRVRFVFADPPERFRTKNKNIVSGRCSDGKTEEQ